MPPLYPPSADLRGSPSEVSDQSKSGYYRTIYVDKLKADDSILLDQG